MTVARLFTFLGLLAVAACARPHAPPQNAAAPAPVDVRQREIDERKDELLRQLAICESGGHGDSDQPIYGARGAYVGRFQFVPSTVIAYVREMDGRVLTPKEAIALAHDYTQAAALARYLIFERGGVSNWPLCARKLGLARQVAEIQAL